VPPSKRRQGRLPDRGSSFRSEAERDPVKRSWISTGLALVLPLVAIYLLWEYGVGAARRARKQTENSTRPIGLPQQLSSDGQASLRGIVQSGSLSELHWPDFSDYDKHVQKFYESYGYSLPWVSGPEGIVGRGLRWAALERSTGETQTRLIATIGSRRSAIRCCANRLCNEICLGPSHREGESEAS
jgi:hypothetical protein